MDYKILDSGDGKKLEQVGSYKIIRPAMNAFWKPTLSKQEWQKGVNGVYKRNNKGSGAWDWRNGGLPESWTINFSGINILVKPTNFGHLGFFAEHTKTWNWVKEYIKQSEKELNILNLFAYSGVGSILMAKAGAKVCHLDAAKGMIAWGKESLALNPDIPSNIRWITDDVIKFLNREIKRGRKYNGVILDPPSYGRGAQGQIWKIEDNINELLELVADVVDKTGEFFIVISAHTPGFSPIVLERLLKHHFLSKKNEYIIESGEMGVLEDSGSFIPAGNFAKIVVKTT